MKRVWFLAALGSAIVVAAACVEHPIGDPAGSNNYDDPDDPGNPGQNSSAPDASGDAVGRACQLPRDCPATMVCSYSLAEGCNADGGVCLPFDIEGCDAAFACACNGAEVMLCAPNGYAPQAVKSIAACNAPPDSGTDAGTDDAADAADDADQ